MLRGEVHPAVETPPRIQVQEDVSNTHARSIFLALKGLLARRGHIRDLRDGDPGARPSASGPSLAFLTTHHQVDVGEVTGHRSERH